MAKAPKSPRQRKHAARTVQTRSRRFVTPAPSKTFAEEKSESPLARDRGVECGRYVYCIIRARQPFTFGAIGMHPLRPDVYTITYKDTAAVVSDMPLAPLDSTRENVLAHERVNEVVMRDHTVIPMSFGAMFKTRDDIVELLRS